MKKKIEGLTKLGLNVELVGDRVVFQNICGIVVHKLGDGFTLQQYDVHRQHGQDCEWVFMNGVRLCRTPRDDFRILKAIQEMFLSYDEVQGDELVTKHPWLEVASDIIKDTPSNIEEVNGILILELPILFEGVDYVIGKRIDLIPHEHTDTKTVVSGYTFFWADATWRVKIRYSYENMIPTIHHISLHKIM